MFSPNIKYHNVSKAPESATRELIGFHKGRLETSPSLFLALPGIFAAREHARMRTPRIPVNPDIRESRYSSEAQKGLVSSLHKGGFPLRDFFRAKRNACLDPFV